MSTVLTPSILEEEKVICALDTYNYTVLTAGMYKASANIDEIPPSGLSIVIQQNGSTKATSSAPAASQGNVKLGAVMNCAINDVISFVISSSSAPEAGINLIKGLLNIHQGSN